MSRTRRLALGVVLLTSCASHLAAQTLGDVAKREEDRRKTVKGSGRTITNRDLQVVPASSTPADQAATAGGSRVDTAGPPSAPGDKKAADSAQDQGRAGTRDAKDERVWRERMNQLRTQLDRDKTLAEALQTRINSLTTDFVNRDDPAQRGVIAADRQKSIDELHRLKKAVVGGTKAIADLEEEARRAGVPAGWLR